MNEIIKIEKSNYFVDKINRTIVCTLVCDLGFARHPAFPYIHKKMFKNFAYINWNGKYTIKAKARCHISDKFDIETGKRIARNRAKSKMYKVSKKVYKQCSDVFSKLAAECNETSLYCEQYEKILNDFIYKITR